MIKVPPDCGGDTTNSSTASTQNQAVNALLFLYRHALGREFGKVEGVVQGKRRPYIPVVLSRGEVDVVIAQLEPIRKGQWRSKIGVGVAIGLGIEWDSGMRPRVPPPFCCGADTTRQRSLSSP